MSKVILKAEELDGYLTSADLSSLKQLDLIFNKALEIFPKIQEGKSDAHASLITVYNDIEILLHEICRINPRLHVFSLTSQAEDISEISRLIAKLRNVHTENNEFVYYIQRSYEIIFKLAYLRPFSEKNHFIVKTPVVSPAQNYAVHKFINTDENIKNAVMCVMLRGALLPSMIISKEIEEHSSDNFVTPFALFKIYRSDNKQENNMEYILDLDKSYFNFDSLNGKDLIFADPMNATGGSMVTVVNYLIKNGVKPRSVAFLNVISALKGALRVIRALENCNVYTLWMDSTLNKNAYIMPGLGDAGDRINGCEDESNPRDISQLLADFGSVISNQYRSQFNEIERTINTGNKI